MLYDFYYTNSRKIINLNKILDVENVLTPYSQREIQLNM